MKKAKTTANTMNVIFKSRFELIVSFLLFVCFPLVGEFLAATRGMLAWLAALLLGAVNCRFRFFISISLSMMQMLTKTNVKNGKPYILNYFENLVSF